MVWQVEPSVDLFVLLFDAGPFDNPFAKPFSHITDYVHGQGLTITRGRSDEFQAFQSGTCSFTLRNNNREFDPLNTSSPFAHLLKPMRRMSVLAARAGILYSLFDGYIEGWPRGWIATTGHVEIVAHDSLATMARAVITPSNGVLVLDEANQGRLDSGRLAGDLSQQFTGQRITALLQLAGFTAGSDLVADTGLTEVIGREPSGNILQLIQDAELAEAGFFFVDASGVTRFYDRHSRFQKPRTANVQMSFDDTQYSDLEVERNLNQVWNDVTFSRPSPEVVEGEDPQEAPSLTQQFTDHESLHDFGILSYTQEIPVVSDGETLGRAEFWVDRYGQPKDRPTPIVVKPRRDMATLFPACAGRELLDRIQIIRTGVVDVIDGGDLFVPFDSVDSGSSSTPPIDIYDATDSLTVTYTGLVEQLSHTITQDDWQTTLAISPIDVDEGADFLILDDSTAGNLDQEVLAY